MKTVSKPNNYKELFLFSIITLFLIMATFPANEWSFSIGIDPPLKWVFSRFFIYGFEEGKHIIFPHGPLAFFMYPIYENVLPVTLVVVILKSLFIFSLYKLLYDVDRIFKWILLIVISFIIFMISGFNHLILANLILLYCNYYNTKHQVFKYLAFVLTAFVFYVKAYVAILSGVLFIFFVLYYLIKTGKIISFITDGFILLSLILLFWIIMYRSLQDFPNYVWGMFHLAQDNSSAAALHPYNNWLFLVLAILLIVVIVLINRSEKSLFYFLLVGASLFAAWKHGMAREDIFHVKGLLVYITICLVGYVLFSREKIYLNVIISVLCLVMLAINWQNSANYYPPQFKWDGFKNFYGFIFNYDNLKSDAINRTANEISVNNLPDEIMKEIGDSKTDVYPWDYSIIAANRLNWQPRVIIQSYASYTSWLDKKNALHFKSENAPEYIIWEFNKISKDVNGGDFNSIDYRYLLNDEPNTLLSIISHYEIIFSDGKFKLLKSRNKPLSLKKSNLGRELTEWDKWIDVPQNKNGILRVKLSFDKTILQRIKSFLYKDEQFWIYLKLQNGSLHKYRIVPENAKEGMWINPYYFDQDRCYNVSKLMVISSNNKILTNNIQIEWEQVEFSDVSEDPGKYFSAPCMVKDSVLEASMHNFEDLEVDNWNVPESDQISSVAFIGAKSFRLIGNSFSPAFSMSLDSIPFQELSFSAHCWIKPLNYKLSRDITLVLTINDENGDIIWKGIPVDDQIIDIRGWSNIYNYLEYNHNKSNCRFNAYVWSTGDKEILIDDFRISIIVPDSN